MDRSFPGTLFFIHRACLTFQHGPGWYIYQCIRILNMDRRVYILITCRSILPVGSEWQGMPQHIDMPIACMADDEEDLMSSDMAAWDEGCGLHRSLCKIQRLCRDFIVRPKIHLRVMRFVLLLEVGYMISGESLFSADRELSNTHVRKQAAMHLGVSQRNIILHFTSTAPGEILEWDVDNGE